MPCTLGNAVLCWGEELQMCCNIEFKYDVHKAVWEQYIFQNVYFEAEPVQFRWLLPLFFIPLM